MSVFSPLDPRGPDQRRKQLVAKLAQQAGTAQAASARTPMPGRLGGPMMSEGRAFHGAGDVRLGGKANVTQAPNILQSVLSRLGVVGKSHAEEMSGGRGLPIAPPAPQAGMPLPQQGSAIPTPNGGPAGGTPVALPEAAQTFQATDPGQQVPDAATDIAGPSKTVVDPGFLMGNSGPVPLGNGLYYDPASGSILGQQDVTPNGAGPRSLGRIGG